MPNVTFLPMNLTFDAVAGESILDVAIRNDIPIQHACGGFCACTTCHIRVQKGLNDLSEVEEDELDRLDAVSDYQPSSRLGCQAKVNRENVVVEVVNLDS